MISHVTSLKIKKCYTQRILQILLERLKGESQLEQSCIKIIPSIFLILAIRLILTYD